MADEAIPEWRLALQESFTKLKKKNTMTPPPEPRKPRPVLTASLPPTSPTEDYTGAACLLHILTPLFPDYLEVLVDAEDMGRLSRHRWRIVRSGSPKSLRVTNKQGKYLHTIVTNAPKGQVVDHIYHWTLDTRKSQLRCCTVRENNCNRRPRRGKPSKYKGVQRNKKTGKWFVHAGPRGRNVFIGGFDSEDQAALAYNAVARLLYGTMAYQNAIPGNPLK